MAKTLYSIRMDFNAANSQANQLDEIAKSLDNLVNTDLTNCLNSVGSNWKGDSANMYIKKGQTVGTNIKNVATNLRTAASTIRTIAGNTYNAEKRAIEAAQKRVYNQK